ncbi:hypothetical protein AURDEDRAFT_74536, partial [Auricularia subglabra TFB-10046 SS5]
MQQTAQRQPVGNPGNPFRGPPPSKPNRYAQLAELEETYDSQLEQPESALLDHDPATTPEIAGAHTALFNTVLATLSNGAKQRSRPTSYAFKESDVVSKVLPPSPCKVCGSDKHWDRECGHWQSYLLRRQQNAMYSSIRSEDEERMYNAVYKVFANQAAFSSCVLEPDEKVNLSRFLWSNPSVEEVEDDEIIASKSKQHLEGPGILALAAESAHAPPPDSGIDMVAEAASPEEDFARNVADVPELLAVEDSDAEDSNSEDDEFKLQDSLQRAIFAQAMAAAAHISQEAGPPPHDRPLRDPELPTPECVLRMPKKRHPLPGQSSKGISVLSCCGRVGSLDEELMTIRLDSCADLCLVHQKFLNSMKNPPRIRKGLKVQIAQLTNNAPEIEGYVVMPMFIRGEDGAMLEFDLEAYVVPEMTVDLLVGEDWHVNYEVDVMRNIELGTKVQVGDTGYRFPATFVRAKSHKRAKASRFRKRKATRNGELRAYRDVVIPAETTALVDLSGKLAPEREWFVERNLVCVDKGVFFSVPNSLLSSHTDRLPDEQGEHSIQRRYAIAVTNPTSRPHMLRAGTVLGYAKDPSTTLDSPKDEEDLENKLATARALAALV